MPSQTMNTLRERGLLSTQDCPAQNSSDDPSMIDANHGATTRKPQSSIPVWSCVNGALLGGAGSPTSTVHVSERTPSPAEDLVLYLLDSLAVQPVHWDQTVQHVRITAETHGQTDEQGWALIDFGPGGGCNLQAVTERLLATPKQRPMQPQQPQQHSPPPPPPPRPSSHHHHHHHQLLLEATDEEKDVDLEELQQRVGRTVGPQPIEEMEADEKREMINDCVAMYFVAAFALGSSWLDWVRGIQPAGGNGWTAASDSKAQAKAAQQSKNARRQKLAARALVTIDSDDHGSGAHSWWACTLVCGAMGRPQPLRLGSLHEATAVICAPACSSCVEPVDGIDVARTEQAPPQASQVFLLTAYQARWMGLQMRTAAPQAVVDSISCSCATDRPLHQRAQPQPVAADMLLGTDQMETGTATRLAGLTAPADHYSDEYVYSVQALVSRSDRSFRKACRRMDDVLVKENLQLSVHTGAGVTKALIGSCMRCRNIWERLRAADRSSDDVGQQDEVDSGDSARSTVEGRRTRSKPPPKRNYYLSSLMSRRLLKDGRPNPNMALFVISRTSVSHAAISEAEQKHSSPAKLVTGYLLTERVGKTIVSVDGVHDYSVGDSRADPSAWLLHVASKWWCEGCDDTTAKPLWLNDGPVPTPGLLRYKSQYHGQLQHLLSLKVPHNESDL